MKLSELNPMLGYTETFGHELSLNCPYCKNRFSIHVNYQNNPIEPSTWGLKHTPGVFDWDDVTITPSISNHPLARNIVCSNPHFSIISGEIVP